MALLKKINPAWSPSENKSLKIGETIEITDYITLIKTGMAVLVDEFGVEQPIPGEVFTCPICYSKTNSLEDFTTHISQSHGSPKTSNPVVVETVTQPTPTTSSVEKPVEVVSEPEPVAKPTVEVKTEPTPVGVKKGEIASGVSTKAPTV